MLKGSSPAITPDVREQIQDDLRVVVDRIEELKEEPESNFKVLAFNYLEPIVDENIRLPLQDPNGEHGYFKQLGHFLINILLEGRVNAKFEDRLILFHAPRYVLDLFQRRIY